VDGVGAPMGILTRSDVLGRVALPQVPLDAPVSAVMVQPVHSLPHDATAQDAALAMSTHGIRHVPVTRGGRLVGIVSERDLVRAIGQSGPKVLKDAVSGYMTKTVVTAREADTIDRLMSEMTTHRFRHMPVVERGRLIGLVSIGDVVKMRIAEAEMEAAAMREYIATG